MSVRRLRNRFVRDLIALKDQLAKLFTAMTAAPQPLGTQRMCPFCGLITPRAKRKCLECGKVLGEIPLEPKNAK